MVRKFWLVNSLGNTYDLLDKNHFFKAPNGLGFQKGYSVIQLGNSQSVSSETYSMLDVNGELVFRGNIDEQYQEYYNFVQFIKNKPIELHYQSPNSLTDYYADVLTIKLDKGEVSNDGLLHAPVTFHKLTQWLTSEIYTVELTRQSSNDGKNYPIIRPYYYAGNTLQNVSITNNGTDIIGFEFEIDGDVQNPQFSISQNNEVYGRLKLVGTFDKVKVNSVDNEEEIYLENDGSVLSNPTSYQDLTITDGSSYITFVKLKVGESVFNFNCGNIDTFSGTIRIKFRNSYVSV